MFPSRKPITHDNACEGVCNPLHHVTVIAGTIQTSKGCWPQCACYPFPLSWHASFLRWTTGGDLLYLWAEDSLLALFFFFPCLAVWAGSDGRGGEGRAFRRRDLAAQKHIRGSNQSGHGKKSHQTVTTMLLRFRRTMKLGWCGARREGA